MKIPDRQADIVPAEADELSYRLRLATLDRQLEALMELRDATARAHRLAQNRLRTALAEGWRACPQSDATLPLPLVDA